jgi:hypothetical protein
VLPGVPDHEGAVLGPELADVEFGEVALVRRSLRAGHVFLSPVLWIAG